MGELAGHGPNAGWIPSTNSGSMVALAASTDTEPATLQHDDLARLLQQARTQWKLPGHPGWGFAPGTVREEIQPARTVTTPHQVVQVTSELSIFDLTFSC